MNRAGIHGYVESHRSAGQLVVQPRMGMSRPAAMAAGVAAVRGSGVPAVATVTLDSYSRVRRHDLAQQAIESDTPLNGYPIVDHSIEATQSVLDAAGPLPVQLRHGSADPRLIFARMGELGMFDTEGGPLSYCLPYSRVPVKAAVASWREASSSLARAAHRASGTSHVESFGGCLLGQLCPPELLIAVDLLEALFLEQCGIDTVSLSLTQQNRPEQDAAALLALRNLADELLDARTGRHVVLYTYMGVFPTTPTGAKALADISVDIAAGGRADRLIVKTAAEAHRIPTVEENVDALQRAYRRSQQPAHLTPDDPNPLITDARRIVEAVLDSHEDVGEAIARAVVDGVIDVPFCLHPDNAGQTTSRIDRNGSVRFAECGGVPVRKGRNAARRVGSGELMSMLGRTARSFDQQGESRHRVAIVGGGPRGIAVLERLVARLAQAEADPTTITIIDPADEGGGRIWQPSQNSNLLMNTVATEVTMFSGPAESGLPRAGAGPTLAEWREANEPESCGSPFATRAQYGRYLCAVLDAIAASAPSTVLVETRHDRVVDLHPTTGGHVLRLAGGNELEVNAVVLATGHPDAARTGRTYDPRVLDADSAADLDLRRIHAGDSVGVRGMGLSFFDLVSVLTAGRGGRFIADADSPAGLRYEPSGREPVLYAGSRSGIPIPARGKNQKTGGWRHQPLFLTPERLATLASRGQIDFARTLEPLLLAEVQATYARSSVLAELGETEVEELERSLAQLDPDLDVGQLPTRVAELGSKFAPKAGQQLDLASLARPFAGRSFADRASWLTELVDWVQDDLRHSEQGNVGDPLKSALDTIRDTRHLVMGVVDHGGLLPESHHDFLHRYAPVASLLSAGPPLERLREFIALIEAGVLVPLGPDLVLEKQDDVWWGSSRAVEEPPVQLDAVVDARVPLPDVSTDQSPLFVSLRRSGLVRPFRNTGGGAELVLGGLDIEPGTALVRDHTGQPVPGLAAIGILTEGSRWFTQVGSGRPGPWGSFHHDADRVAGTVLAACAARRKSVPA